MVGLMLIGAIGMKIADLYRPRPAVQVTGQAVTGAGNITVP
jgi:hypothetical protein